MSTFAPQVTASTEAPLDQTKHVRYTLGMILGDIDFKQEFAYLSGRDQWMARDLIGYGTVCGLHVDKEPDAMGPQIVVTEGVAVTPRGQLVRVPAAQCADLNAWLRQQQQKPEPAFFNMLGSPPNDLLPLYVVLCYRDCPTDQVPIPGEPCRDESEAMAASRLTDDFRMELRSAPPDQREEDAMRDFVAWLGQVEITDEVTDISSLKQFEDAVREAAHLIGPLAEASPPASPPDYMYGSPPQNLRIPAGETCDYLRAAFRIWATELRPRWTNGCGNPPAEECLLLAQVNLSVTQNALSGQWVVDDVDGVDIKEERRPYLIPLRLLQEWLLCGQRGAAPSDIVTTEVTFGQGAYAGTSTEYSRGDHTHGTPPLKGDVKENLARPDETIVQGLQTVPISATPPTSGQVLTYNDAAKQWQASDLPSVPKPSDDVTEERAFGLPMKAGTSTKYSRGDHTHGTPPDPIPPHSGDPKAHTLTGDVNGSDLHHTVVTGLQGVPVVATTPSQGQVLTFQNNQWEAANPTTPSSNAVEHPGGLPPYLVLAAGMVKGDSTSIGPVYNQLIASASGDGELTVSFSGYRRPRPNFQYIIKVLPVFKAEAFNTPIVSFTRFDTKSFVLHVTNAGKPVNRETLTQQAFMIEVSQFFAQE